MQDHSFHFSGSPTNFCIRMSGSFLSCFDGTADDDSCRNFVDARFAD